MGLGCGPRSPWQGLKHSEKYFNESIGIMLRKGIKNLPGNLFLILIVPMLLLNTDRPLEQTWVPALDIMLLLKKPNNAARVRIFIDISRRFLLYNHQAKLQA